jgi:hypothetical protein
MKGRYYTLEEARRTLPRIQQLMEEVQRARKEIIRLRPEVWPALKKAASNGGNHTASELAHEFGRLERSVKGITDLGIYIKDLDSGIIDIKDLDSGIIDFLGMRDGREVFLCWRLGEDDIRFWHDLNTGFAGRQPIDSLVS